MNKFLYILICFVVFQTQVVAQASINDYKYIIVPKQFDFLSSADQYETSSLTKFLFNKYGYTAYFDDDDLPEDLSKNRCLGLKSDIKKMKGFLITRLQIDLLDCNGNIIMSSEVGETKIKEYKQAYQTAIREAFTTYKFLDYKYVTNNDLVSSVNHNEDTSKAKEIEKLKKEVAALKAKKEEVKTVSEDKKSQESNQQDKIKEAAQELFDVEIVESVKDNIWYAQPIDNGFQIVDTQPKKVMILLDTGTPNVFIVKGKDAIVYKKDGSWVYAENSGENLQLSVINLKF